MGVLEIILIVFAILLVGGGITAFVIWQLKKKPITKFTYITKHGIKIKLSPKLQDLKAEMVEKWTEDLVQFWHNAMGWNKEKIYTEIGKSSIIMYDELYLERAGMKVNAITWPNTYEIEIATLYDPESNLSTCMPLEKVESLFIHEESHIIVGKLAPEIPYDDEHHHILFSTVKLGA